MYEVVLCCIFLIINVSKAVGETGHDWAVQISGGETVAKKVANEMNFLYLGPVGNLEDVYHFQKHLEGDLRAKRSPDAHTESLSSHKKIKWVQPQTPLVRTKRRYISNQKEKRKVFKMFNDPKWPYEWYIYNTNWTSEKNKFDMQIVPVWNMNVTGKGVKLTIIDDGLEHTHQDIKDNYDPLCSSDFNDNDDDPMPNTAPGTSNEHGTRCASQIVMSANNNYCGVGVAYDAKIGGIRVLDGTINDAIEAKAIGFNNNYIDIYSASWGPQDNGRSMEKPGLLANAALERGTKYGRKGKGNIFVWASGNGGYFHDTCSCDGYVSSMYVISVGSILSDNTPPPFKEKCPSTMCVTYSATPSSKKKLIVADVRGQCVNHHSGTSASAPFAAGIFALALEMNSNLTWRDIKHLIAWTSQIKFLTQLKGWKQNNRGFWVNDMVGFGLLDAYRFVNSAKNWRQVPDLQMCHVNAQILKEKISNKKSQIIMFDGSPCSNAIKFIENVIVKVTVSYTTRGALHIKLRSPHGMNTTLLYPRMYDNDTNGLTDWPFNTVHNWGESPAGNWTVFIEDKGKEDFPRHGFVQKLTIEFHGMNKLPNYVEKAKNGRRKYGEDDE